MAAVSPVLILIGLSMIENIKNIDFTDMTILVPSFFIIIMMPFSYSITTGIEFGFILYSIVSILEGRYKEVSKVIYLFSILFIIKYLFGIL